MHRRPPSRPAGSAALRRREAREGAGAGRRNRRRLSRGKRIGSGRQIGPSGRRRWVVSLDQRVDRERHRDGDGLQELEAITCGQGLAPSQGI